MNDHHLKCTVPASSRRTFLTATAAAIVGGSAAGTIASAASPIDPMDELFRRWRAADVHAHTRDYDDDDDLERRVGLLNEAEDDILAAAPCIARTAAVIMIEMRCRFDCRGDESASDLCSDNDRAQSMAGSWAALETLRPYLSGLAGEIASDLLDHPDRLVVESKLFTAIASSRKEDRR